MKKFWTRVGFTAVFFVVLSVLGAEKSRWGTDVRAALKEAKQDNRWVLIEFTGLDWCGPCVALQNNALKTGEFSTYAKDHLALVELDFPKRRPQSPAQQSQNAAYQRKFKVEGFPTLIVLRPDGTEAARWVGYRGQTGVSLVEDLKALQAVATPQPPLAAK
jgi:thioredoxin-related protein